MKVLISFYIYKILLLQSCWLKLLYDCLLLCVITVILNSVAFLHHRSHKTPHVIVINRNTF